MKAAFLVSAFSMQHSDFFPSQVANYYGNSAQQSLAMLPLPENSKYPGDDFVIVIGLKLTYWCSCDMSKHSINWQDQIRMYIQATGQWTW